MRDINRQLLRMCIRKIVCYQNGNEEYIILQHDHLNAERKMDELMELMEILLVKGETK